MAKLQALRNVLNRRGLTSGASALGGMILGAVVGIAVQAGLESTGLLGPTVDTLIDAQQDNFEKIHSRLETLRQSAQDPAVAQDLQELASLIETQDELRRQASTELAYLGGQVAELRDARLAEDGFSGGADFWLLPGESVSVGNREHVMGVVRLWTTAADVVLNGKKTRLSVGASVDAGDCKVFFKQAIPRDDRRVGFDVTCS